MGSIYEFKVKVFSNDSLEDNGNPSAAARLFMEYGTKHQEYMIEVQGQVDAYEIECIQSDDGKHFTFENEESADHWTEWWQYKEDEWIREQDCFHCGTTVEETRSDDA